MTHTDRRARLETLLGSPDFSPSVAARQFGVTRQTIYRDMAAMGETPKTATPPLDDEQGVSVGGGVAAQLGLGAGTGSIAPNRCAVPLSEIRRMVDTSPMAAALANALQLPATAAECVLFPHPKDDGIAEVVRRNLFDAPHFGGMETPLADVMSGLLLSARDGFAVFEEVWDVFEGVYRIKNLAHRDAARVKFEVDAHGNVMGARQTTPQQSEGVFIDESLCLRTAVRPQDNGAYGKSLLTPAYHIWKGVYLRALYIALLAFAQIATPAKKGTFPKNAQGAAKAAFKRAVQSGATAQAFVFPEGFTLDMMESNRQTVDLISIVKWAATEMAMSVGAQWLTLGQSGTTGAGGASGDQSGNFGLYVRWSQTLAEIPFNRRVIADIAFYNGSRVPPTLRILPPGQDQMTMLKKTWDDTVKSPNVAISDGMRGELERLTAPILGIDPEKLTQIAQATGANPDQSIDPNQAGQFAEAFNRILAEREDRERWSHRGRGGCCGEDDEAPLAWVEVDCPDGVRRFAGRGRNPVALSRARGRVRANLETIIETGVTPIMREWRRQFEAGLKAQRAALEQISAQTRTESGSFADPNPALIADFLRNIPLSIHEDDAKRLHREMVNAYEGGAGFALSLLRGSNRRFAESPYAGSFRLRNQQIIARIEQRENLIKSASEEMFARIQARLQSGVIAGDSPDKLARALAAEFGELTRAEIDRIVRTESAVLMNSGNADVWRRSGADGEEWQTAGDDKVREEHAIMDGERRIFPNAFSNGDEYVAQSSPWNDRCAGAPVVTNADVLEPWEGD